MSNLSNLQLEQAALGRRLLLPLIVVASYVAAPSAANAQGRGTPAAESARQAKHELEAMAREEVAAAGVRNPRVLSAIRTTPRQEFVPIEHRANAFRDMALPIGYGQSISPPFVVAYMTEKIDPQTTDKVLEIGTGSGYQAAVLSPLVQDVYTIEIVEPLGKSAADTLERLGYANVHAKIGDGYQGWPEHAPFDKIIVTCSPENVPQPLVDQLREGGRIVIPLGERFQQTLYLVTKKDGKLVREALEPTMFVPMTGRAEDLREVLPDPTKPGLLNGGFEEALDATGSPPGWYYMRHFAVVEESGAPEGSHVIRFRNSTPGISSRALQAFGVDGRKVKQLDFSFKVRVRNAKPAAPNGDLPQLAISFFDELRVPIGGIQSIGPWQGTFGWREETATIDVPAEARMAIVWIGLIGATGEAAFDDIRMTAKAVDAE